MRPIAEEIWYSILAVVSALTIGGLFLLYLGESPAEVYGQLWLGAMGSRDSISSTLAAVTPYLLAGLALALAFQAKLFNIGAEGQIFAGALAAALVGRWLSLPLGAFGLLAIAIGAGMLWALVPIVLKAKRGIHEVITTILLNYIVFSLASFLVRQPSIRVDASTPRTADIALSAQLPVLSVLGVRLEVGLFLALGLAWGLWHFLQKTWLGYEIRVVGLQPEAARGAGIAVERIWIVAFVTSGGLAGLAGGLFVASPSHPFFEMGFSPGWGFWGIALALLARNHPAGVVAAAFLFGLLDQGASYLDTARGIPREVILLLQAVLILLVSARVFPRLLALPPSDVPSGSVERGALPPS